MFVTNWMLLVLQDLKHVALCQVFVFWNYLVNTIILGKCAQKFRRNSVHSLQCPNKRSAVETIWCWKTSSSWLSSTRARYNDWTLSGSFCSQRRVHRRTDVQRCPNFLTVWNVQCSHTAACPSRFMKLKVNRRYRQFSDLALTIA